ncbi:MAG: type II secretion system protein GspG [Planctomycetota bacterium]|nr:type II secretion system protein GspG [Planctomycetota bacterium]
MQGLVGLIALVLAVLICAPRYLAPIHCGESSTTSAALRSLAGAVAEYAGDHDYALPASLQVLHDEGYLRGSEVYRDHFGSPYAYRVFAGDEGYLLASLGDDGQFGGVGDAANTVFLSDFTTPGHAHLFTYDGIRRPER